ncbi:MAG: 3'-5' exonuclease [Nitrosomonadales bacterium]|nr:3'-5' exonuclease [Nitrosomonadales bacterium]
MDSVARFVGKRVVLSVEQQQRLAAWRALPASRFSQPWANSRCVVMDVETSGLDLRNDRLISIGAVAVVHGRIALGDSYSVVLQQDVASTRENILLHGISGSAQRDGMPAADALLGFLEYLGKDTLVAFHVTFDETMLRRAMRDYLGLSFKYPWLDLAYLMPALNPALAGKHRTLDDWVTAFGISIDARHDALADALATAQLWQVATTQAARNKIFTFEELCDLEQAQRWVYEIS